MKIAFGFIGFALIATAAVADPVFGPGRLFDATIKSAMALAREGHYLYGGAGDGFFVVDIAAGGKGWRERGQVAGRDQVYDVAVGGDRLFTAEGEKGFGIYDITGPMPREIARLPRLSPDRHLAFWTVAVSENRVFFSDRRMWTLYDVSKLPKIKKVIRSRRATGSCPATPTSPSFATAVSSFPAAIRDF